MKTLKAYACYLKNDEIRMSSSSGAFFSGLASYIFSLEGIVYGVGMSDDCYSAEFISVTDENGLKKLRGSKYLQARVGSTYKNVKNDLNAGKIVLFTGTGCQINGLKNFLGKEYENLICVDIICHGVPSPLLWQEYVKYQEKTNGGKLKHVNFRCKDDGWINYGLKKVFQHKTDGEIRKVYISKDKDPFMLMFLRDYCLRPSCYECKAKEKKLSDLTIADFWGIQTVAPEMNDNRGISLVLIRSQKGMDILKLIYKSMVIKEVSYEDAVRNNPAEYRSVAKPSERDVFFSDLHDLSFSELTRKYAVPVKLSTRTKVKNIIKNMIKNITKMQLFIQLVTSFICIYLEIIKKM